MRAERAALRIGEVARRTGVGIDTLRAWERRYRLLEPTRTEGGHRLYSDDDVEWVRAVQDLVDDGWAVTAAAAQVRRRSAAPRAGRAPTPGTDELRERLQAAIDGFDGPDIERVLDVVLGRLALPAALEEVVLPALRWIGEGWEEDARVIAREHLATNVLRSRLHGILRGSTAGDGASVIAATPRREEHDVGVLAASAVATGAGWRVSGRCGT